MTSMNWRGSVYASLLLVLIFVAIGLAQQKNPAYYNDSCTDIIVGKLASVDGSVITSHTGCCDNCRMSLIPGKKFKAGEMADVYYGLQDSRLPIDKFGEVLGQIPQVEQTYAYFHTGYPQMNEHQLAIGESTLSQREELQCERTICEQIMSIEMAQVFALQRCKTAREAITLIGGLMDKYGFLPSCGPESEALCIADPNEAWVFEVFAVGPGWDPESGEPGAIWAAQRVPDDHVCIVPNWSIIKEIDLSQPDWFMASDNYMQFAIDQGWYDPNGSKPFIWQEVYAPQPREWAMGRLWLFYSTVAPNLRDWPVKDMRNYYNGYDAYHQYIEDIAIYPFSVKPEKKMSVKDVIDFQRSVFEGTIYDMTNDFDWYVPDGKGGMTKSPLTTPFPTKPMRDLLDITYRRMVSRGGYGMVAQCRSWLPDEIGGVYWFYVDNQHISTYVPIYAGVQKIHPYYQTWNPDEFDDNSARWCTDFVDNLLYLNWQEGIKDVRAVRDPMEARWHEEQAEIDMKALEIYKKNQKNARKYLTEYTNDRMVESVEMFRELRKTLITKYSNNKQGL